MTDYLVELTPCDMFFFGTEERYRPKGRGGAPHFEADYFQRSARFPQQTTILGALRYLVLQENGQIPIKDQGEATRLIGPQGFRMNGGATQDYGAIQSLGPVFIRKEDAFYMPAPLHLFKDGEGYRYGRPEIKEGIATNQPGKFIYIEEYDEKKGLTERLGNIKDMTETLSYEDVFVEVEKVGIHIKQREEAYYKQISYKFKPGSRISFALKVTWDDGVWRPDVEKTYYVALGAEKHVFGLKFMLYQNQALEPQAPEGGGGAAKVIILTSDAYIEENTADFSIVKQRPFRFLESRVMKKGKYARWGEGREITRSRRYHLFERGSVFFFLEDRGKNDFMRQLASRGDFRQVGYNHFIES